MVSCRLVLLLILGGCMAMRAETKPEWQKAFEMLEGNAAKTLQPLNQLLQDELVGQKRIAAQQADEARLLELDTLLTAATLREEAMSQGLTWHPGRQEAGVETFCREAAGKKWTLKGTQQVRHFRLVGRDIVCISDTGNESQQRRGAPLLPGVFVTRRTKGGATVYTVSPDMKKALCMVVSRVYDSLPQDQDDPTSPDRQNVPDRVSSNADLLTFMTADLRHRQWNHEKRLVDFLESQLKSETAKKLTPQDLLSVHQRLSLHRGALAYYRSPPGQPSSFARIFTDAAKKGRTWSFPVSGPLKRVHFDGKWIRSLDAQDKDLEIVPAEIMWPGLIRMKTASGKAFCIATSPDLRDAQLMPILSQFQGTLSE